MRVDQTPVGKHVDVRAIAQIAVSRHQRQAEHHGARGDEAVRRILIPESYGAAGQRHVDRDRSLAHGCIGQRLPHPASGIRLEYQSASFSQDQNFPGADGRDPPLVRGVVQGAPYRVGQP